MPITRKPLVFPILFAACLPASALEFTRGNDVEVKLKGTLNWGTQIRTEPASPEAYGDWPSRVVPGSMKGRLQGQTGGSNLNFERGQPISTVLKAVVDLDLKKDNVGLFLRGSAWNDSTLGEKKVAYGHYPNGFQPGRPLSDKGFEASSRFNYAEWRDAYLYADFQADTDSRWSGRLGRQVLQWGRSTLQTGGINAALNPTDLSSQLRPGAAPSEGQLPWGLLSVKWTMDPLWRLEGFSAYESRRAVLPACGTYFDVSSFAPPGCNFAALAGASEQNLLASGAFLHRNEDVKAKPSGQYGLALGVKLAAWDADVQFVALNTHSTLPSLRMTINSAVPGVRAVNYAMAYPENVSVWGMSFLKKLAPTARLSGELAYRPHQPINLNAYDVLTGFVTRSPTSLLALNKGIMSIPVGGTFDAYDRLGVVTGSLGMDMLIPKTLGADRVLGLIELGFSQVNGLPDTAVLRYGRPLAYNGAAYAGGSVCMDVVPGKTCTSAGYITKQAWGLKIRMSAVYDQGLFGLKWTPSLLIAKDVRGYAHDGAYSEGRLLVRPALRFEQGQSYFAEIQYNRFSGGQYNLLIDHDFISVVAGARF